MLIRKTHPILKIINGVLIDLPCPPNISYFWNYGSLLGLTLAIQFVSGLLLATRYTRGLASFDSVVYIFQDTNYGWIIRLFHSTGASFFFLFMYLHLGRGLYYGSYKYAEVWNIGVIILILLIAIAFLGYVLPWGQMSYWAATVITNFIRAVPYFGSFVVQWVWGGFAVSYPTLVRFYMLHYLLPFVLFVFVALHIMYLHETGRNNPLGLNSSSSKVSFHYYYSAKDVLGFVVFLMFFLLVRFTYGYVLIDRENFIPANFLVTPTHIQPEWYFLFAYAILRSIPNKLGGVLALVMSLLVLFILPLANKTKVGGVTYSFSGRVLFWSIVVNFVLLTWLGIIPAEFPYTTLRAINTFVYFLLFLLKIVI